MAFSLTKADKRAFAVAQTIYSGADTNLYFDWEKRLGDTMWSDEGYWLLQDGVKIGGILILEDCTRFPFLIEPFCDRALFWRVVIDYLRENRPELRQLYSVLEADVPILLSYGYKVDIARRIMCRPTEIIQPNLASGYEMRAPTKEDVDEMTAVVLAGYQGGIDYELDGEGTEEEARHDIVYFLEGYEKTNTTNQSALVYEKSSGEPVGLIMAGRHPGESPEEFSSIADITVLPAHQGKGIAAGMIRHALSEAAGTSDLLRLCVTQGNNAEALYRNLGFWGGPHFTNMSLR